MHIRRAVESDFAAMWPIFQKVVAPGVSYVFAADTSYEDGYAYWFAPGYSGKGAGRKMGQHCLRSAKAAGYQAMQFNFVVSSNAAAVALWKKLGFAIVGTLPKAFLHSDLGYVDAYVMHRFLDDIEV